MEKWFWIVVTVIIVWAGASALYPFGKDLRDKTKEVESETTAETHLDSSGIVRGVETVKDRGTVLYEQPTPENGTVDREKGVKLVASNMYFVYNGKTIVLPELDVVSFLRSDCKAIDTDCIEEVPCVQIPAIRTYIAKRLTGMLEGQRLLEEAQNENGSFLYRVSDWGVDEESMLQDIVEELTVRIQIYQESVCDSGIEAATLSDLLTKNPVVWVLKKEGAGTDGLYASKYIEVDDSQQHLYLWQDGGVIRDYEISGFYPEYAVYGVFSIINKSVNAWSSIAKKWMPWWMAYYYDGRQNAMLGIHELVYWTDENGVYHEESSESIGKKKSGGCIRLDRGQARELYDVIEVGTPVLIHE